MSALRGPARISLRPLKQWLFDPVPVHAMVIGRIGLGSVLVLAYLSRWPLVDRIYGPDGFAGYAYFQRFPESGPIGWDPTHYQLFEYLQYVSSSGTIWALYLALLVSSLCFALGAAPRVSGTIALVLHSLFLSRNPAASWGWATMLKPFLIYVILADTARHYSVVAWLRGRMGSTVSPKPWTTSAWPVRLLQVHIACVFVVLWTRLNEDSWLSGQMLPAAMMSRDWARFDIDWFPYIRYLELAGIGALILELGAPIALWIKPIAKYWALGLMGLFATLVLTTSVGWWDFLMLVVLTVFLPQRWLERVIGPSPPKS